MRRISRRHERGGIVATLIALLFLAVLLFVLYLARHPILRYAGESLVVEDTLERSDAIIILSDDNFYGDRATRAAEVYRQNLAPVVVASGVRLRPFAGIAELMTHDLVERGVPRERILPFPQDADNTREEAEALKKLIQEKSWKSVIVVTSNYHTRRARYIVEKIWGGGVRVEMAAARDADFDPSNWYAHRKAVKRFFHEVLGFPLAVWELHGKGS
ncbi:MAG TPA: YdcF family protein [Dongiaceae bacterium]|nr:YdcF family protein [Dongiaceae bacterium]